MWPAFTMFYASMPTMALVAAPCSMHAQCTPMQAAPCACQELQGASDDSSALIDDLRWLPGVQRSKKASSHKVRAGLDMPTELNTSTYAI